MAWAGLALSLGSMEGDWPVNAPEQTAVFYRVFACESVADLSQLFCSDLEAREAYPYFASRTPRAMTGEQFVHAATRVVEFPYAGIVFCP